MQQNVARGATPRFVVWLILLSVLAVVFFSVTPLAILDWLGKTLPVFGTVFLGIFIEATPFLLLGTLTSGLVEVYLDKNKIGSLLGRSSVSAAVMGAFLGLIFPVCECGVVPLTRRLFQKGMPLSAGVAFLLAAPVINPIVIISTVAAFGWGRMVLLRLALSLVIAITVGMVFSTEKDASNVLRPMLLAHEHKHDDDLMPKSKLRRALLISADEFFEMGRYLVVGALLAAALQAFIPQSALLAVGNGPALSVIVMLALAILLSICSTVDAFVALGFANSFSFGSVLSFLVFGPMVDIKSVLMYLQVFKRRPVAYLVLLPFLFSLFFGVVINYWYP